MGLFELFGAGAARAAPALGPAEKYFDQQPVALVRAALAEDASRVRELVAAGVNANSQGPRSNDRNTPQITLLGYAISQRSEAALRLLIQAGADPLFKPREGDGNAFGGIGFSNALFLPLGTPNTTPDGLESVFEGG